MLLFITVTIGAAIWYYTNDMVVVPWWEQPRIHDSADALTSKAIAGLWSAWRPEDSCPMRWVGIFAGAVMAGMAALLGFQCCRLFLPLITPRSSQRSAVLGGIYTGVCVMASPSLSNIAADASSSTLTCALLLGGAALLILTDRARSATPLLHGAAGILLGAACANNLACQFAAMALIACSVGRPVPAHARMTNLICMMSGMAVSLALLWGLAIHFTDDPLLLYSSLSGLPWLFPSLRAPDLGAMGALMAGLPITTLVMAPLAIVMIRGHRSGRIAVMLTFASMLTLLFWPILTNPFADGIHDIQETRLAIVTCLACVAGGCGAGLLVAIMPWSRRFPTALACLALFCAPVWQGISTRHDTNTGFMKRYATAILAACPEGSVLVCGSGTADYMQAQRNAMNRTDVLIISTEALTARGDREPLLTQAMEWSVDLPEVLVTPESLDRWAEECPAIIVSLLEAGDGIERKNAIISLAIWDLLRYETREAPVRFLGVSAEWLAARCSLEGPLLAYPATGEKDIAKLESFLNQTGATSRHDREARHAADAVLFPAALWARAHGLGETAYWLAERVTGDWPNEITSAQLRRMIQTRYLLKNETARYEWWRNPAILLHKDALRETDQMAVEAREAVGSFNRLMNRAGAWEQSTDDEFVKLAVVLWRHHELDALEKGLVRRLATRPREGRIQYEYAAVLAQQGRVREACDALAAALESTPSDMAKEILSDSRLYVLRDELEGVFDEMVEFKKDTAEAGGTP